MSLVTTTPGRVLVVSCPTSLQAVRAAARSLRGFLEQQGLGAEEMDAWELIIVEAGNNAVLYAAPPANELPIEFAAEVSPTNVEVRIRDHTPGLTLPAHFELPDPLAEGGRGLFLIHSLTDSMDYFRGNGSNCFVLRKKRQHPNAAGETGSGSVEGAVLEATLQTMTEELAASYESLSAIFRFTEDLSRTGVDATFLERWFEQIKSITGADWIVLRMVSTDRKRLETTRSSAGELALLSVELDAGHESQSSVEWAAARELQDVWFDVNRPLDPRDPLRRLGPQLAGFAHPLHSGDELSGVLTTGCYGRNSPFTAGQVNIIQTLADFLGIQIRNTQFQQAQLQNRLLERDYDIASRLQQNLLPRHNPRVRQWSTHGYCRSAQRVGGDFYDLVPIGPDGLLLAVADVMGKGLPAALFATIFRTLLRSRLELAPTPALFLDWLNRQLARELDEADMFITAQVAYVDFATAEVRVSGAGHPPLLLVGRGIPGHEVLSSGAPLGIDAGETFGETRLPLPPSARLLMYSDGVTELTDAEGNPLGTAPLLALLHESVAANEDAERILARFAELQQRFQGDRPAADDQTLVLLTEDPTPTGTTSS